MIDSPIQRNGGVCLQMGQCPRRLLESASRSRKKGRLQPSLPRRARQTLRAPQLQHAPAKPLPKHQQPRRFANEEQLCQV